jgi:hypothetical protein
MEASTYCSNYSKGLEKSLWVWKKLHFGERGIFHWRVLNEKDLTKISELRFERVKENKIMMPHPLKENLAVGGVTNWYNITTTTLGLLGLMHKSHKEEK